VCTKLPLYSVLFSPPRPCTPFSLNPRRRAIRFFLAIPLNSHLPGRRISHFQDDRLVPSRVRPSCSLALTPRTPLLNKDFSQLVSFSCSPSL